MHHKQAILVSFLSLGLFSSSVPCYSSELLDELMALLPAQNEIENLTSTHPDLQAICEMSNEQELTYSLDAEMAEERFSISKEQLTPALTTQNSIKAKLKSQYSSPRVTLLAERVEEEAREAKLKAEKERCRTNTRLDPLSFDSTKNSTCSPNQEKEQLALLQNYTKKNLKRAPSSLANELSVPLEPSRLEPAQKGRKPPPSAEHSRQERLYAPTLPSDVSGKSEAPILNCEKEHVPLLSTLKVKARRAALKLEQGVLALFAPLAPAAQLQEQSLASDAQATRENLPSDKTVTEPLFTPREHFSAHTPTFLEKEPVTLTPKKMLPKQAALPLFDSALLKSVALTYQHAAQEKELARSQPAHQQVSTSRTKTALNTHPSPTSSAILKLNKEKSDREKTIAKKASAPKKHLTFAFSNHFNELDLPERAKQITPHAKTFAYVPQKKARVLKRSDLTPLNTGVPETSTPYFHLQDQILIGRKERELPQVKIPVPQIDFSLMSSLPQTEFTEPVSLHELQPLREQQQVQIALEKNTPVIDQALSSAFSFENRDTPTVLTTHHSVQSIQLTKASSSVADDLLDLEVTETVGTQDPLFAAKSSAALEPTWKTKIEIALTKAQVPLLTPAPLIERKQLQAGNLLFAEDKMRDRTSHERHAKTNRLYRNLATHHTGASDETMLKVDSAFDPYVEYATDGTGSYYFAIELRLQKDLELPTQKQSFLFLIDRSKATDRQQYESYKRGVMKSLAYLKKGDTFNVYIFDSRVKQLSPLPLTISKQSIAKVRNFLSEEKHGILFRSAKIYDLIGDMVSRAQNETHLTNIIFMAGPKTLSDLRTKRPEVQKLLDKNRKGANLFFATSCDKENFPMMQLMATMNHGQAIYSPTNTGIPRKIANLVHRIARPVAQEVHVMTRSEDSNIELYSSTKLNRPHLYRNNAFKVYGRIDTLKDFDIILQGKGEENWLHMTQRIKIKNALRVGRSLRKTLAGLQVLPLYKQYIEEGNPDHLWEATKITSQHNIEEPYTWD